MTRDEKNTTTLLKDDGGFLGRSRRRTLMTSESGLNKHRWGKKMEKRNIDGNRVHTHTHTYFVPTRCMRSFWALCGFRWQIYLFYFILLRATQHNSSDHRWFVVGFYFFWCVMTNLRGGRAISVTCFFFVSFFSSSSFSGPEARRVAHMPYVGI